MCLNIFSLQLYRADLDLDTLLSGHAVVRVLLADIVRQFVTQFFYLKKRFLPQAQSPDFWGPTPLVPEKERQESAAIYLLFIAYDIFTIHIIYFKNKTSYEQQKTGRRKFCYYMCSFYINTR